MADADPQHIWETLQSEGFAVKQEPDGTWTFQAPAGYSGGGYATPDEAIADALRLIISAAKKAME